MSEHRDCRKCCFYGKCISEDGCDDYYPANDDGYVSQDVLDADKESYFSAWIEYISEYN